MNQYFLNNLFNNLTNLHIGKEKAIFTPVGPALDSTGSILVSS